MSKTILITGASSGIGKETAKYFRDKNWNVVATMRNPDDASELAGENVLITKLDILDSDTIKNSVSKAKERFGSIDVLLNNAGYGSYGPLEGTPMTELKKQFDVNFFGLVELTQEVLPIMRGQKSGIIMNVSSIGGRMAFPFGSLYHSSKWAVEGLSEALQYEVRLFGGIVKIIEPGGVKTNFGGRSFVFSNNEKLDEYQPMVQAFQKALSDIDYSNSQEPYEVAEVIWQAATDNKDQLRYVSGTQAKSTLSRRYSIEKDEEFVQEMRKTYGM